MCVIHLTNIYCFIYVPCIAMVYICIVLHHRRHATTAVVCTQEAEAAVTGAVLDVASPLR